MGKKLHGGLIMAEYINREEVIKALETKYKPKNRKAYYDVLTIICQIKRVEIDDDEEHDVYEDTYYPYE